MAELEADDIIVATTNVAASNERLGMQFTPGIPVRRCFLRFGITQRLQEPGSPCKVHEGVGH